MKPSSKFKGIKVNKSVDFPYFTQGTVLNLTAAPMGFYIVWDSNPDKGYSIKNYVLKPIVNPSINFTASKYLSNLDSLG